MTLPMAGSLTFKQTAEPQEQLGPWLMLMTEDRPAPSWGVSCPGADIRRGAERRKTIGAALLALLHDRPTLLQDCNRGKWLKPLGFPRAEDRGFSGATLLPREGGRGMKLAIPGGARAGAGSIIPLEGRCRPGPN